MPKRGSLTVALRIKSVDATGRFSGYGSVFNVEDSYGDAVAPGAFTESLKRLRDSGRKLPVLWQHMSWEPIGTYTELREDEKGLYVEGQLSMEVMRAQEAHALLRDGAITGLSIGFMIADEEYDKERRINILKEIDLWEISLVTFPANDLARITGVKGRRAAERALRDAGFSRSRAKAIVNRGLTGLGGQREVDDAAPATALTESGDKTVENFTEIKSAFEGLKKTFEDFKVLNDQRLDQIAKGGVADPVTTDAMTKANLEITALKERISELEAAKGKPGSGGGADAQKEAHRTAFVNFMRRGVEAPELKAVTVGTPADGGYAVPEEIDRNVGQLMINLSPMRSLCNVITIGAYTYSKLFDIGGTSSGWVGETDARAETNTPQLAEITPFMGEIYAMPKASQQSLEDLFFDVEGWLSGAVAKEFSSKEGVSFVTGSGTKQPKGFLSYVNAATADGTRAFGQLQYYPTGTAGAFKTFNASTGVNPADDIYKLISLLKKGHRMGAAFMFNSLTEFTVRTWKDANGNYLWQPALSAERPATLAGYPVETNEDMPDPGTSGGVPIAFANWKAGYTIVDRRGILVLRDPYTAKPHILFYTTKRVGGMVEDSEAIKLLKQAAS